MIELDKDIATILNMLDTAGYQAYAVGGYVRNKLMGIKSTDCDITTSATPTEIKSVFNSFPVIDTGIKHGTVTVIYNHTPHEITTFRTEGEYTDSRHPNTVEFVKDITLDLSRRDFTVNAIAYNPIQGIIDPFNGIKDINNKLLRTVGNPQKRFSEDALRILRALRFASVLGFAIHQDTALVINKMSTTLANISAERIYNELNKLLLGENAYNVLTQYESVFKQIIPINSIPVGFSSLPKDFPMRITALCDNAVLTALNNLKADNLTKRKCKLLITAQPIPTDITAHKLYISSLGREEAAYVAKYRRIIYGEDIDCQTEQLLSQNHCLAVSQLAINGTALLQLGIESKVIGDLLQKLLYFVIIGELENTPCALLQKAKTLITD